VEKYLALENQEPIGPPRVRHVLTNVIDTEVNILPTARILQGKRIPRRCHDRPRIVDLFKLYTKAINTASDGTHPNPLKLHMRQLSTIHFESSLADFSTGNAGASQCIPAETTDAESNHLDSQASYTLNPGFAFAVSRLRVCESLLEGSRNDLVFRVVLSCAAVKC
jgi:hypothetical protein